MLTDTKSVRVGRDHRFGTNVFFNLSGLGLPALAALLALPHLAPALGTERLGFLTLAWGLLGYLGLLDLGLGRALTKQVAERAVVASPEQLARIVQTGIVLMAALGTCSGLVLAALARWLIEGVLQVPKELETEAICAMRVLAVGAPFVTISAGLRGVLEGLGLFRLTNLVRAPLGTWLVASPLLLPLWGSRSLTLVAVLLVLGRAAACGAYACASARHLPLLLRRVALDGSTARTLLRFGGWITVSNVVSPLMATVDRFIIATCLTLEAVAWYATPFEAVTKILLLSSAMTTVLFPMFSSLSTGDSAARKGATELYAGALLLVPLVTFLPCFGVALFAEEGLEAWLGRAFAEEATVVTRLFALGCFLNSTATVPFALLQGAGQPSITARIHLLEAPPYFVLLFVFTATLGINGAALAGLVRFGVDLCLLYSFTRRLLHAEKPAPRAFAASVVGALLILGCTLLRTPFGLRLSVFTVVTLGVGMTLALSLRRVRAATRSAPAPG